MANILSKRLMAIGKLVTPGSRLADIGTDHALLPVALVRDGVVPCAIAMDVNEGPLARAREGISRCGLGERITTRLSDGFEALRPGEADSAVIAGMGGDLMIRILTQGMDTVLTLQEIICSPQSEIARVRAFARNSGFQIDAEDMVLEDGKYYQMFRLRKAACDPECTEERKTPDEMQDVWDHYGPLLIRDRHPVLNGFLEREKKQAEAILLALKKGGDGSGERKQEIRARLERIEKACQAMDGGLEKTGKGEHKMSAVNGEDQNRIRLTIHGKEYTFPTESRYRDVAAKAAVQDPDSGAATALLILENNKLREMNNRPVDGSDVSFVSYDDKAGWDSHRRTLLLIMRKAIQDLFPNDPDYAVTVHFTIDNSLYCTLGKESCVTDSFLEQISDRMRQIIRAGYPIKKQRGATEEAIRIFHDRGMKDKEQLFRYRMSSSTNLYELDGFLDYYYGYMLDTTAKIMDFQLRKHESGFVLLQPQRIVYGTGELQRSFSFEARKKVFDIQMRSKKWGASIGLRDVGDLNDRIVSTGSKQLILVQEAYHEGQIAAIAEKIAADPRKRFVMIAGPSSSGKTTFSHRLSVQLAVHGITPHPIPVDDYFLDREKTPLNPDGTYNFECLEAIDIEQFNHDMLSLLDGQETEMPTFNFKTGKREYKGKKLKLGEGDIMVIEGIHCLNDALSHALPSENKFKIYISALTQLSVDEHDPIPTTDGRLLRRIVRDARTRGTSAEGTISMWPSVRFGEENYIFPFQESADVMFNSALIYELAVLKVYAQPLLFGIDRSSPAYTEARRLLKFLDYFVPISSEQIPVNSLVREFIGGSCFDV